MYCLEVFVKYRMKIRMNKSQKLIQLINIFNLFYNNNFHINLFLCEDKEFHDICRRFRCQVLMPTQDKDWKNFFVLNAE